MDALYRRHSADISPTDPGHAGARGLFLCAPTPTPRHWS